MKTKNSNNKSIYVKFVKRTIDFVVSLMVLASFWWLYAILAVLIKYNLGSPVLFTQERPGKDGKIFKLYKFRSMSNAKDKDGNLLPDKERLNKFGKVLRSTSLDEIPELFNILKGDMSIVGPRPLLVKYLDYYNQYENRRHEVRSGLTGLAQISGRNTITWRDKFAKDVEYVDNLSFLLDLKIFILTIKKVFVREGIEFVNTGTIMEYFEGQDRFQG